MSGILNAGIGTILTSSSGITVSFTNATLHSDATYYYVAYKTPGTFTNDFIVSGGNLIADILPIGGGGAGGSYPNGTTGGLGGGGAAGGINYYPSQTLNGTSTITVGLGGQQTTTNTTIALASASGGFSRFTQNFGSGTAIDALSLGGGRGGGVQNTTTALSGYNGGGGSSTTTTAGTADLIYSGNSGGSGRSSGGASTKSGGGGGGVAIDGTGTGGAGTSGLGGSGGNGTNQYTSWAIATNTGFYFFGQENIERWYCGGGAGGNYSTALNSGNGTSGNGSNLDPGTYNNTGGGGNGGSYDSLLANINPGKNGGNGLVIIRYTRAQVGG